MDRDRLKYIMRRKGFSQERLAAALGMDRTTVNRKLNSGKKGFYIEEVYAVGKVLGLSRREMTDVFFGKYGA